MVRLRILVWTLSVLVIGGIEVAGPIVAEERPFPVALRLTQSAAVDQDDLCIWRNPAAPDESRIIVSDKSANQIFVYDLQGNLCQSLPALHPGNIDLRSEVPWRGQSVAICVVNERDSNKLLVYRVDGATGHLERIDNDAIVTGENYGGTLLQHGDSGRLDFLVTSKMSGARQFSLVDDGQGRIAGRELARWDLGICEGAVGDDEKGQCYVSVESQGVYRLEAGADGVAKAEWVIRVGENGLVGDVEGLVLVRGESGARYLVLSDQGASRFRIYQLGETIDYRTAFSVEEVTQTDGFDLTFASLGTRFPAGLFGCHSDMEEGRVMRVVDAAALRALFP